jgi:hypothetical protein
MAKRRNKATKIRAELTANPNASAKEIIAKLKAQRVRVTPAHVYNVRAAMENGTKKQKLSGYEALFQAKRLADAMGGIDKARAALDVLARLV